MFADARNTYYNAVVSFWKKDPILRMVCLGTLIRKNIIFVTNKCANNLEPINRTVVQTGTNFYDNITSGYIIQKKRRISTNSKFAILIVSNSL